MSVTTQSTTIQPFKVPVAPQAELEALRARVRATRWPDRELVPDHSQGVRLATIQALGPLLGERVRLAPVRGPPQQPAAVHHRDRRPGHSLHPCPLETPERPAGHHHPWMAWLDHRTAEGHRSTHRSHRARRHGRRRLRRRDPVEAGPGFSGKPTAPGGIRTAWPGPGRLMPRLATRDTRPGRRLGGGDRPDGGADAAGTDRNAHQHGRALPDDVSAALAQNVLGAAPRLHPICRPRSAALRAAELLCKTGLGFAWRWPLGRRLSAGWRTRPSGSRPGCSTTTRRATPTSPGLRGKTAAT